MTAISDNPFKAFAVLLLESTAFGGDSKLTDAMEELLQSWHLQTSGGSDKSAFADEFFASLAPAPEADAGSGGGGGHHGGGSGSGSSHGGEGLELALGLLAGLRNDLDI